VTEAIWVALIVSIGGAIANGYFYVKAAKAKVREEKAKKSGNNPHPCVAHSKWLKELDNKVDAQAVEQAKLMQCAEDMARRLDRIEGKLNGIR